MKLILTAAFAIVALHAASRLPDAAMNADHQTLRALIDQKADINAAQPDGMTALHWAVRLDDLETAKLLVHAGANVQAVNRFGLTPLSLAASNANTAMIRLLLAAKADPNFAGPGGETALMTAASLGNVEPVKALLEGGANVNIKDSATQSTALMIAVREHHPEAAQLLIAHGADATMGMVYEPYLELTPHEDIFTRRLLQGDYFAEAAYASERGLSWMLTVVGDPLYLRRIPAAARTLPDPIRHLLLDFPRQALHAARLGFAHPRTGVLLSFASEPPTDMAELLNALDDDLHSAQPRQH